MINLGSLLLVLAMSDLPLELADKIVKHIPKDTHLGSPALKSASLVSPTFRIACQQRLFSVIYLRPTPTSSETTPTPGEKLWNVCRRSPNIATYIKAIQIYGGYGGDWLLKDTFLPMALRLIVEHGLIQHLEFVSLPRWYHVLPETKRAIAEICLSPSLLSLKLDDAPVAPIGWCGSSVKELILESQSPETYHTRDHLREPNIISGQKPTFEYISLPAGHAFDSVDYLLNRGKVNVAKLRELKVDGMMMSSTFEPLSRLTMACGSSLESLSIEGSGRLEMPTLNCAHLLRLRSLSILFSSLAQVDLVWIVDILKTFARPHLFLETVNLRIEYPASGTTEANWQSFARTVSDHSLFLNMDTVRIEILWRDYGHQQLDDTSRTAAGVYRDQVESYLLPFCSAAKFEVSLEKWYNFDRQLKWSWGVVEPGEA
ncbi:hypothetical protein FA15DRAFT_757187, partial [Coprinopsis marcescibilis]